MPDYLASLTDYLNALPLGLRLVGIIFAAAIEYVFPIFPGDTVIILAGFLRAQGGLGLFELILATLIGTLLGASLSYYLGLAVSKGTLAATYIERYASPESLARFRHWFYRWGYFVILVNRFFPGIRAFFFFAAGLYRLPLPVVLICGVISALLFNACLFGLGYFLGNNISALLGFLTTYTGFIYVIIIVPLIIFLLVKYLRKAK